MQDTVWIWNIFFINFRRYITSALGWTCSCFFLPLRLVCIYFHCVDILGLFHSSRHECECKHEFASGQRKELPGRKRNEEQKKEEKEEEIFFFFATMFLELTPSYEVNNKWFQCYYSRKTIALVLVWKWFNHVFSYYGWLRSRVPLFRRWHFGGWKNVALFNMRQTWVGLHGSLCE